MNTLDDTFKNLYHAIVSAQEEIEDHAIGEIRKEYFDKEGNPLTTPVMLPIGEGGSMAAVNIPLITLVPHHGLSIKEVEVEMEVAFSSGDSKILNSKKQSKVRKFIADLSGRNKHMAKIRVKFQGENPPEGLARIKDNLIKIIP